MRSRIARATRSIYASPGISYLPWLIMLPFSIMGTGVFVPEGSGEWQAGWFAVGLLAHLVLLPIIFIFNLIAKLFSFRFGSILILGFIVMGATRGLTVSFLAEDLALVEQANFAWRIGTAIFLVSTWYAVGNAAVFEIRDYSQSMGKLRGELLRQSQYLDQSEAELQASRKEVLDETLKLVDFGLIQVETRGKDPYELQKISSELHHLVDDGLTPMIRKLQESITKPEFVIAPYQKVSGWKVAATALIRRPFNVTTAIILQTLSAITSKIWGFGVAGALVDWLLVSSAILTSYWIGSVVLKRLQTDKEKIVSNLLFLSLPAIVSGVAPLIVVPGSDFDLLVFFSLFNNVFAAGFLSAIGFAAKYEAERVIEELNLAIEQTALARSRAEQLRLIEKKRLSRILHGSVQAKIRSLALQIERTGKAPEKIKLDEFRNGIIDEISNPSQGNLVEFLYELKELWGASAEISYTLDDQTPDILVDDNNAHVAVVEIIREVVSNAMKHSKSKKLSINIGRYQEISESLGIISISAVFDGTKITTTYPGNGIKTISELSSHFSYYSDSSGNHFNAEIPVSAQVRVATTGT